MAIPPTQIAVPGVVVVVVAVVAVDLARPSLKPGILKVSLTDSAMFSRVVKVAKHLDVRKALTPKLGVVEVMNV
jgi:hypothetical protein